MARRKGGLLIGVAGVAVVGALIYGVSSGGASTTKVADPGGGPTSGPSPKSAPYAISTLGPIGTAAQDPGGGGGGTGAPGLRGDPGHPGRAGIRVRAGQSRPAATRLYLSGVNLLDTNRSADHQRRRTRSRASARPGLAGPRPGPRVRRQPAARPAGFGRLLRHPATHRDRRLERRAARAHPHQRRRPGHLDRSTSSRRTGPASRSPPDRGPSPAASPT